VKFFFFQDWHPTKGPITFFMGEVYTSVYEHLNGFP